MIAWLKKHSVLLGSLGAIAAIIGLLISPFSPSTPPTAPTTATNSGIYAEGNINISAKNGGSNVFNFGITIDDHQRILTEREKEIRTELAASTEAETEKRIRLKIELEAVQSKLNNLAQSYKESQKSLSEANQALIELKQQLPETQFKKAQAQLQQGKTSAAKEAFVSIAETSAKHTAKGYFEAARLAEEEIRYREADR